MNVVDSSGWLEYFSGGSRARVFAPAVEDTDHLVVPTICLLEVFRRVLQQCDEEKALQAVSAMHEGHVVPLDDGLALEAARLGVDRRLPLADSVVLATARRYGATLWTQDSDFEGMDGVRYVAKR